MIGEASKGYRSKEAYPMKDHYFKEQKQSDGFTLIELLTASIIIGILAGVSLANFSRHATNEQLKAVARSSITWLEESKQHAIQSDAPCRININHTTGLLSISHQNNDNDALDRCTESENKPKELKLKSMINNVDRLSVCSTLIASGQAFTDPISNFEELSCEGTDATIFSPRGTLTSSMLIILELEKAQTKRCIALIAPYSTIRSGIVKGGGACDYTTTH